MEKNRFLKSNDITLANTKVHQVLPRLRVPINMVMCRDSIWFIIDTVSIDSESDKYELIKSYSSHGFKVDYLDKYTLAIYMNLEGYFRLDGGDYACLEVLYNKCSIRYNKITKSKLSAIRLEKSGYCLRSVENSSFADGKALKIRRGDEYEWPELQDIRDLTSDIGTVSLVHRLYDNSDTEGWTSLYYPVVSDVGELLLFV